MNNSGKQLPAKLFRFVRTGTDGIEAIGKTYLEATRDCILEGKVWFSKINKLNDPFEGRLMKSNARDEFNNNLELQNSKISVCCFTEENHNMAMWTHYASGGKGICLEYNTAIGKAFNDAKPIKYIKKLDEVKDYHLQSMLQIKSNDWAYEKEWRIFSDVEGYSFLNEFPVSAIYTLDEDDGNNWNYLSWTCGMNVGFFIWDRKRPNNDLKLNFIPCRP